MCVNQSCTSILLYKFLADNCIQLYSTTETLQYVIWTMQRDQPIILLLASFDCFWLSLVFSCFCVIYLFSLHQDLKIEWNSYEIGVLLDFIQK